MWASLIAGVRSETSRPSGHAEKPKSGGAFRGFAVHGGCGAASAWGAFRGFATLGARETASEWGRVSMVRDPQRMQNILMAGARFKAARSSGRAGKPDSEGPFRAFAIFGASGAASE